MTETNDNIDLKKEYHQAVKYAHAVWDFVGDLILYVIAGILSLMIWVGVVTSYPFIAVINKLLRRQS